MAFKRYLSVGAFLALSLSGCALFSAPKQLDTYDLSAPAQVATAKRTRGVQILVTEPTALKSFDGQNIVIKPQAGVIQYLKGAQWADRLPRVVQARLIEALQQSGRFAGVGKPGEGLAIDYQVVADIRAFDIVAGNSPHAEVTLFVRLVNDRNGTVKAQKLFSASAPVSGAGNVELVQALDHAFDGVADSIVRWSVSAI